MCLIIRGDKGSLVGWCGDTISDSLKQRPVLGWGSLRELSQGTALGIVTLGCIREGGVGQLGGRCGCQRDRVGEGSRLAHWKAGLGFNLRVENSP